MVANDKTLGGIGEPACYAISVTPSGNAQDVVSRAVYVGVTGNLAVTMVGGDTVTFVGVPAGALLPIRVTHILVATTASSILILY